MKRIYLFAIMYLISIFSVFGQTTHSNNNQGTDVKIEMLTVETFKNKITQYGDGKNEWNYLGSKPCIIDFYASWCRPCRMLSPELQKIANKYKKQIVVYKIDTEAQRELASLFSISSIPALLFIPIGDKQPIMLRGYRDANQLEKEVEKYLLTK